MTSLIDVIFLLLLFFMLSSTFSRFGDIELTSGAGGATSGDNILAFAMLQDTGLTVNGETVSVEGLAAFIDNLKAQNGTNGLVVSVRQSASSQQLVDLLVVTRGLEGVATQLIK
ncbi:MAG: biopolymer transporter ExbD [Pseudomonadota bacterium]